MRNFLYRLSGVLLAVTLFLLPGCRAASQAGTEAALTPSPGSALQTPLPPTGESPVAPPPTEGVTQVPTITDQERRDQIVDRLASARNCRLPCWWDIQPGRTTWAEAQAQLQHWGLTDSIPLEEGFILHGVGGSDIYPERVHAYIDFLEKIPVIERIRILGEGYSDPVFFEELWKDYAPQQILVDYGVPDRVFVDVYDDKNYGSDGTTMYYLWLVYDRIGFYIEYHGFVEYGDTFHICPQFDQNRYIQLLTLFTQRPGEPIDLHTSIDLSENQYTQSMLSLEEAVGITPEEFFQRMTLEGGTGCIDTPLRIWQTPMPQ